MRSIAGMLLACAAIACGARSGLPDFHVDELDGGAGLGASGGIANGGTGGVVGGGGTPTGGVGGVGAFGGAGGVDAGLGGVGGITACTTRGFEGIAGIDGVDQHHELDPDLVLSSDDGMQATLMFRWIPLAPVDPIGVPPPKLGHLDFAPWQEPWPTSLGQAWVAQSYGSGETFALGDAPGNAHAYMFHDDGFTSGAAAPKFVSSAVPKGPSSAPYNLGWMNSRGLFVVRGETNQLVGFEQQLDGKRMLSFVRYEGTQSVGSGEVLCTHTLPISASAVRATDAYLIASTTDVGIPDGCDSSTSPAQRITLLRFDATGVYVLWELFTQSDIRQVKLLKRPNGLWLLWQKSPGTAAIQAMALDPNGNQVAPPTTMVPAGTTHGPFAATALGSGFVIAYPNSDDSDVFLDVFAESGIKLFDFTTPLAAPPPYGLLASPNGNRLLLSFAAANPEGEKRTLVARFCLPPGA